MACNEEDVRGEVKDILQRKDAILNRLRHSFKEAFATSFFLEVEEAMFLARFWRYINGFSQRPRFRA